MTSYKLYLTAARMFQVFKCYKLNDASSMEYFRIEFNLTFWFITKLSMRLIINSSQFEENVCICMFV